MLTASVILRCPFIFCRVLAKSDKRRQFRNILQERHLQGEELPAAPQGRAPRRLLLLEAGELPLLGGGVRQGPAQDGDVRLFRPEEAA